jgi:hypothetical protein
MQMIRSLLVLLALTGTAFAQQPIRTGIDATFAPHAMPKAGGGLEGFNIDLANELAKRMHRPITIDGTEFSALIPGMNAKKYDFLIAPTTVTPERSKAMLFSEGYMETDYMFLQKKADKDIKGLEDLKGKTITVNKGSAYETWAKANAEKYGFKYDVYGTNADAFLVWTVENPDRTTNNNRLLLTETRPGTVNRSFLYARTNDGGIYKWVLTDSGGLRDVLAQQSLPRYAQPGCQLRRRLEQQLQRQRPPGSTGHRSFAGRACLPVRYLRMKWHVCLSP